MLRLHEIPIVVVGPRSVQEEPPSSPSISVVLALLCEIETKLSVLATEGQDSTIDLRWLIGMPQEFELLVETLGQGEVSATVSNIGVSVVQETSIPCVWRVSHRDHEDKRLGEFIEIAEVPELLSSNRHAIPQGLAELGARRALLETPPVFPSIS
jgi:hydrogenase-1 operon protein HyaF